MLYEDLFVLLSFTFYYILSTVRLVCSFSHLSDKWEKYNGNVLSEMSFKLVSISWEKGRDTRRLKVSITNL